MVPNGDPIEARCIGKVPKTFQVFIGAVLGAGVDAYFQSHVRFPLIPPEKVGYLRKWGITSFAKVSTRVRMSRG